VVVSALTLVWLDLLTVNNRVVVVVGGVVIRKCEAAAGPDEDYAA